MSHKSLGLQLVMQSNRRWSWKTVCVIFLIIWKCSSGRFLMDWLDMNSKIPAGRANGIPQESVSGWRRWRQEGVQVAGLARTYESCIPTPSLFTQAEADLPTLSFKLHLLLYVLPHRWQDWRSSKNKQLSLSVHRRAREHSPSTGGKILVQKILYVHTANASRFTSCRIHLVHFKLCSAFQMGMKGVSKWQFILYRNQIKLLHF